MSPEYPVSLRVVELVARQEGVDPADLEPPLQTVVETEALDALFRKHPRSEIDAVGLVEFDYCGYLVRISRSGEVELLEANGGASIS